MAGRHSGWRRLSGDTADRPDLLDYGKKLLAYLDTQRGNGTSTLTIQRTMQDGSVVMARYVGDLPEIYVRDGGKEQFALLDGFFARPTTQDDEQDRSSSNGTWWTESDDEHVELAALRPHKAPVDALRGHWFDAASRPEGAPAWYLQQWFPDGLKLAANTDWTGDAGVLYYFGPANRLNDPSTYYRTYIYHNGALLLDTTELGYSSSYKVIGCALHPSLGLLVALYWQPDIVLLQVHVGGRAQPWYRAPRLVLARDAEDDIRFEVLGEFTVDAEDAGFVHPLHFNQRADECRAINWRYDAGEDRNLPYEIVIARDPEDDTWGLSTTALPYGTPSVSGSPIETGAISSQIGSMLAYIPDTDTYETFGCDTDGNPLPSMPTDESLTSSFACATWTKIAVDYRDNVPVYLEMLGAVGSQTVTQERSWTVNSGDGAVIFRELSMTWGSWYGDIGDPHDPGSANVTKTLSFTLNRSLAPVAYRTPDLLLQDSEAREVTTSSTQTIDVVGAVGDPDATITGSASSTSEEAETTHLLLYVDLRHGIVCYKQETVERVLESTSTETSGWVGNSASGGTDTDTETTGERTKRVVLNVGGVEVESDGYFTEDLADTDSASVPKPTPADTNAYTELLTGYIPLENPAVDLEIFEPPQLSFTEMVRHVDFGPVTPHDLLGSWAVSGQTVAYSYAIQQAPVSAPELIEHRHGFCSLAGVKHLATTWPSLTGANDPSDFLRYSPVCALSPFMTKLVQQ